MVIPTPVIRPQAAGGAGSFPGPATRHDQIKAREVQWFGWLVKLGEDWLVKKKNTQQ